MEVVAQLRRPLVRVEIDDVFFNHDETRARPSKLAHFFPDRPASTDFGSAETDAENIAVDGQRLADLSPAQPMFLADPCQPSEAGGPSTGPSLKSIALVAAGAI